MFWQKKISKAAKNTIIKIESAERGGAKPPKYAPVWKDQWSTLV